ncbi:hypothetical protein [Pontiella sulfatireligans]|uniref:Uncharacterized protein n=1 Tax=Pontiella sulfatireligans TaxID=2750658 RepID=A0A6C2ULU3_9BACT|nr:hypothetical protein [Pontiella sulfatireligans]VGO21232.1 hypothetical protein SCARR_03304 [Pontiella sulfatireligans]
MKKLLMTVAVLACATTFVSAQVTSANIVGYGKVAKPGDGDLNIMGISFQSTSNNLSSICPPNQFKGSASDATQADRLYIWDSATDKYTIYALYDISFYGGIYENDIGWQNVEGYGFGAPYVDPVLPAGSAVWIQAAPLSASTNVITSGEVVSDAVVTNQIVSGLQIVSNPFSNATKLNDLNIAENATGDPSDATLADQITVWNEVTQKYEIFALYYYAPPYDLYNGWQPLGAFGYGTTPTTYELKTGQGFWYNAKAGFEWVESNKYLSAFN